MGRHSPHRRPCRRRGRPAPPPCTPRRRKCPEGVKRGRQRAAHPRAAEKGGKRGRPPSARAARARSARAAGDSVLYHSRAPRPSSRARLRRRASRWASRRQPRITRCVRFRKKGVTHFVPLVVYSRHHSPFYHFLTDLCRLTQRQRARQHTWRRVFSTRDWQLGVGYGSWTPRGEVGFEFSTRVGSYALHTPSPVYTLLPMKHGMLAHWLRCHYLTVIDLRSYPRLSLTWRFLHSSARSKSLAGMLPP